MKNDGIFHTFDKVCAKDDEDSKPSKCKCGHSIRSHGEYFYEGANTWESRYVYPCEFCECQDYDEKETRPCGKRSKA